MNLRPYVLKLMNFWPPFLFSGIKIIKQSKNYRHFIVKLKLRFWTANYVGTQYGGSMFSMVDPFYMLMLMKNLGNDYVIWDKAASIRYLKPGKTDVTAEFILTDEDLKNIHDTVKEHGRMIWNRTIEIKDKNQEIIAEVEKVLSIKKREK
jgi:acyl-coenzyme A thioesterase PaaI-like protein